MNSTEVGISLCEACVALASHHTVSFCFHGHYFDGLLGVRWIIFDVVVVG